MAAHLPTLRLAVALSAFAAISCGGRAGRPGNDSQAEAGESCQRDLGISCGTFREAYVKASNAGTLDEFGYSVSQDADFLAVGALLEMSCATGVGRDEGDDNCPGAGAVYTFRRDESGNWVQELYIKPSHQAPDDRFGRVVALSGDTLAVAAEGEDGCRLSGVCEDSGAVFLFRRGEAADPEAWIERAHVKASNAEAGDNLGDAVALSGDTLAVSAILEGSCATGVDGDQSDNACPTAGAVYVFRRVATGSVDAWEQEAYLKASNTDGPDGYHYFGRALSLFGDTLVVGADGEDGCDTGADGDQAAQGCPSAGAVYVFRRKQGAEGWRQEAYLKASNTQSDADFGAAVALYEDTLAVGAPNERSCATGVDGDELDESCEGAGAVYVFQREQVDGQPRWQQRAYLKASNTDPGDAFGAAVSLHGTRLVAGARQEDGCATDTTSATSDNACDGIGAAYLFNYDGVSWSQQAYLKPSRTDAYGADAFGHSVSLFDSTLVVGAPLEDGCSSGVYADETSNDCAQSGAVYVRRIAP